MDQQNGKMFFIFIIRGRVLTPVSALHGSISMTLEKRKVVTFDDALTTRIKKQDVPQSVREMMMLSI